MPSLISRAAPEWFLAIAGLYIGVTLLIFGDARLGIYVLWLPGVTLWMVKLGYALLLWAPSVTQIAAVVVCRRRQPLIDGACALCPSKDTCRTPWYRRAAAFWCFVAWAVLTFACLQGGLRSLGAPFCSMFALGEAAIFALLSPQVARWRR